MDISRLNENELFLQKTELVRTFRQKDMLRNLLVRIEFDVSHIYIRLKTETILIFLFGLFPRIIGLFGAMPLPGGVGCAVFFWTIGFLSKLMILSSVKNKLELSLQKL